MIRSALIPAYLFLCLCLGGASAGGFVANCILQLIAVPLIAWSLLVVREDRQPAPARSILGLTLLLVIVALCQLIPLPPAVWTVLPGRASIADGYRLLGMPLPWLPLSLASQAATASALWLLPAFAVLLGIVRLGAFRALWIGWIVVAAAMLGVVVGALQVLGGAQSPWYLYRFTNWGQAVGLFANGNHMATLLVVAIPFATAIQASWLSRAQSRRHLPTILVVTWAPLLVIAVGLAINTSLAGLGLGVTVAVASALLLRVSSGRRATLAAGLTGVFLLAALGAIFVGPVQNNLTGAAPGGHDLEQLTRRVSISKTLEASRHYMPVGSGVGSFRQIYQQAEDPRETINTFMNHAHSDVAEIVLETGGVGITLLLLLLAWWAYRATTIWRSSQSDYFARAGTIASGAIIAHSCVDYPLRTAAISAVFAASLALMSEVRPFASANRGARASRHLEIS